MHNHNGLIIGTNQPVETLTVKAKYLHAVPTCCAVYGCVSKVGLYTVHDSLNQAIYCLCSEHMTQVQNAESSLYVTITKGDVLRLKSTEQ